ncbi:hypothetical protein METH_07055 [Leisingera methylohalidivorans DSM 14336]|uniref:Uncharacterized protein n=1 Tax=Leisingera methylohalidivorans DSM 14336 TaxID=999552 RepID=V9W1C3_9RHOB|nr:hypothetical protein METH_07055 [Leisingera methylohalidivorans DSM 14336]
MAAETRIACVDTGPATGTAIAPAPASLEPISE